MQLRQAIAEQWEERFNHDTSYLAGKLMKLDDCDSTSDLIYHCMNIDDEGLGLIAGKLGMSNRDINFFISTFRSLDQCGMGN